MHSTRTLHGLYTGSTRILHGLYTDSTRTLHGLYTDATRILHGLVPFWVRVQIYLSGASRGILRNVFGKEMCFCITVVSAFSLNGCFVFFGLLFCFLFIVWTDFFIFFGFIILFSVRWLDSFSSFSSYFLFFGFTGLTNCHLFRFII